MPAERERGAALLTVLLIVSVIAVLAATTLARLNLAVKLAANAGGLSQARAYALATEDVALTRIEGVLRANPDRITLDGDWAGRPRPVALPGGSGMVTVTDGGNCFNLNGLVTRTGMDTLVASPVGVTEFTTLMTLIGMSPQDAAGIAAAAADWIDSDAIAQPGGGEDAAYTGKTPGYLPGNTLMADPSELRAVAGVTPALYARLRPWVCALPDPALTQINVNTLTPEQAPLLAMLLPDALGLGAARAAILARPAGGYRNAADAWKLSAFQGTPAGPQAQAQTAVTTRWFRLAIRVRVGSSEVEQTALVDGKKVPARLVARAWGGTD